jgi:hypothetical protein
MQSDAALRHRYFEQLGHFLVKESKAGTVWLHPFAVDHKLRNGALACVRDDLFGGAGSALDVDFGEGDRMFVEEAFGFAAVAAPGSRIDKKAHTTILADWAGARRIATMVRL